MPANGRFLVAALLGMTNTNTSSVQLIKRAYTAFNARDMDAALATMQPDVEWPNGMEGGTVHGHVGIREYWTRQWGMIDPHVDPVTFQADNAGRIVVSVHQVVRDLSGNILVDQILHHTYTIRNGLIERMDIET